MRQRIQALACLALSLLLPACADMPAARSAARYKMASPAAEAGEEARGFPNDKDEDGRLAQASPPAAPGAPGATTVKGAPLTAGDAVSVRGPILIYTAQVSMSVYQVTASLAKVEAIARELGGFLAKRDDASITIRVPAATFDQAVTRIESVGDVLHKNVAAEDVTDEFHDLEIRLKSAKAVQTRLSELLAKATKVEDSLAIERELDRVSGEIERIEGRLKFLRDRAAFSTITVRFEAKSTDQLGDAPFKLPVGWLYEIYLSRLLNL
jgi:hypothetical protein